MNLVSSTLPNLGSGSTSRLGTSLRLGILISFNLFSWVNSHEYPIEYSLTRPLFSLGGRRAYLSPDNYLGRLAPYLERACLRSLTPAVSKEPRTVW